MSVDRWDLDTTEGMARASDGEWVRFSEVVQLSAALADMIDMYETKKRNSVRLGNARAALTNHGVWPEKTSLSEGAGE